MVQANALNTLKIDQNSVVQEEDVIESADWLIYGKKSSMKTCKFITNITLISAINVMLFTGPLHLTTNNADHSVLVNIDECFKFALDQREAQLFFDLKLKFDSVLNRYLHNRNSFKATTAEMRLLDVLVNVMIEEDTVEKRLKIKRANALNHNQ